MEQDILDYERGIIGAIFVKYDKAYIFRTLLTADDFTDSRAVQIYQVYLDTDDYQSFFDKASLLKGLGSYISEAADSYFISLEPIWKWAAKRIAANRKNKRITTEISDILTNCEPLDLLPALTAYINTKNENAGKTVDDSYPKQLAALAIAEMSSNQVDERIFTGIKPVDTLVCGLSKGNVSVLGAAPSTGKTTFALNIAATTIRHKKKVLFISLEMTATQLMHRLVASEAEIDYSRINNRRLGDKEKDWYRQAAHRLTEDGNLFIFDTCYYLEQIAEYIISIKPDLVIIDFLQFCRTRIKLNNTADRIEYIVGEFKRIAKLPYCSCHIMLLSQPSRMGTGSEQSMFNLKGSSAIEQGGDVVILLNRPAVDGSKEERKSCNIQQAYLTVAKNKFGKTGKTRLYFDGEHQRFREEQDNDIYSKAETQWDDKPWLPADNNDW